MAPRFLELSHRYRYLIGIGISIGMSLVSHRDLIIGVSRNLGAQNLLLFFFARIIKTRGFTTFHTSFLAGCSQSLESHSMKIGNFTSSGNHANSLGFHHLAQSTDELISFSA